MGGNVIIATTTDDYLIHHDCMLYVARFDSDGGTIVSVYRSGIVRDDDRIYEPVAGLIDGAELDYRTVVGDDRMMFGRGELSLYELAP
jgi:hypothetical protein